MNRKLQSPPIAYAQARQADLATSVEGACCPTCGRPWSGLGVKICRKCGDPIAAKHRFSMIPVGPGVVALEHHDCSEPTLRNSNRKGRT